ncbi:hypothetical protein HMPREF3215_02575 [Staphylococcus simulans]|nr:hypothetical protein HMPREF3215_02575 [Staphylococcus simulans]
MKFNLKPIQRLDKKELLSWVIIIIGVTIYRVVKRKKAKAHRA